MQPLTRSAFLFSRNYLRNLWKQSIITGTHLGVTQSLINSRHCTLQLRKDFMNLALCTRKLKQLYQISLLTATTRMELDLFIWLISMKVYRIIQQFLNQEVIRFALTEFLCGILIVRWNIKLFTTVFIKHQHIFLLI